MDKETLSNYGWIVICVLVLAVMIALATPFGDFIANGVKSTTQGLFDTNYVATNEARVPGLTIEEQDFGVDMSKVSATLSENDWSTISKVIKAGKTEEAGWKIGDFTAYFSINNKTKRARIVDISDNKVTFMISTQIGVHNINSQNADYQYGHNIGGYAESSMRAWLDGEIYNSIDEDLRSVISPTNIVCTDGDNNPNGTKTITCHLYLPSIKEVGLRDDASWYQGITIIDDEGEIFEWFKTNEIKYTFWTRSTYAGENKNCFFVYKKGVSDAAYAYGDLNVRPVFVIS